MIVAAAHTFFSDLLEEFFLKKKKKTKEKKSEGQITQNKRGEQLNNVTLKKMETRDLTK